VAILYCRGFWQVAAVYPQVNWNMGVLWDQVQPPDKGKKAGSGSGLPMIFLAGEQK